MRHSLFIVAGAQVDWFNAQADGLGNGGAAIGVLKLSATGSPPATHGWCAVGLTPEQEAAVKRVLGENPEQAAGVDWTDTFPARDLGEPRYAGWDHVAVGWGERDFFVGTPTWWDL